ncbi:hypothetical protein TNCV_2407901 [Trichonephila clavipes]|nr:hypothetical protein TNCV_2407901 [Trichonephila clavipes]
MRRTTRTGMSTMIIHRQLIEHYLCSYRLLTHLPFTPAHCRARLQWCQVRSGLNHTEWGHIVLVTNPTSNCVLTIIEDVS